MAFGIDDYNGKYKVSPNGIVSSKHRIMKGCIDSQGYLCYTMRNHNGIRRRELGHRLVAISFIPNPDNKDQVNHIDGNKLNNDITNLEWCTQSENMIHAYRVLHRPVFITKAQEVRRCH